MVCGGLAVFLTAHGHTNVLSSQILVVVCGGLRWCVVVCGGLWWFAVVCGGLWWIAVVCLLVIPVSALFRSNQQTCKSDVGRETIKINDRYATL